ncbi:MAG: A24 family peptidase [Alphaproteobacteria bacterium]|nr:A24 family peptidase [Alphaproteobacteria bacterium]MCL2758327.1 A24 family peptidase [Alphaproteobacteria bacterium]
MAIIHSILFLFAAYFAVKMSLSDFQSRIIPDVFLFPFLIIGLLLSVGGALPWTGIEESAVAAAVGYGLAFVINAAFKRLKKRAKNAHDPIGMGDIKLLAAGGIWLGISGLSVALIAACILGYIWGRAHKQKFVPFAPFFFAGMAVAMAIMSL